MNDLISVIILAIIQGATEWLPVSSSGHLVLFSNLLNFEGGLAFDVTLHLGTLLAVIIFFWKDLFGILKSLLRLDFKTENGKLILLLIMASLPAVVIGFVFYDYFKQLFSSTDFLSWGIIITALLLFLGSFNFSFKKEKISYFDSFIMGIGQAIAIIPSISRSGSTIVFGFLRGIKEEKAARFSFLMSIPVIFGANILIGFKELTKDTLTLEINSTLILGIIISFAVGILTIHWLMKSVFKNKKNLRYFALYCLLLGLYIQFFGI